MPPRIRGRGAAAFVALAAAFVFLVIEAIGALTVSATLHPVLRFATLHTVYVIAAGIGTVLAVIAAIVLSGRWVVVLIGACLVVAAVALFVL